MKIFETYIIKKHCLNRIRDAIFQVSPSHKSRINQSVQMWYSTELSVGGGKPHLRRELILWVHYSKVIKMIPAIRLLTSLDMTPGQSGPHDSSDVAQQCLTNMLHRDAGDRLYPGDIVNVMAFTAPGSVSWSEREVQCLLSFLSKPLNDAAMWKTQRSEKH